MNRSLSNNDDVHDLAALCARLRQIPRDVGDYTFNAQDALTQFGLGEYELEALRHAGLHGQSADGEYTYAECDLHYVGLRHGVAKDALAGIKLWRTSLERLVEAGEARIHVSYIPKVSDEIQPVNEYVVLPDDPRHPVKLRHLTPAAEFTVTQSATWPVLPDDAAAVVDEVASGEFCLLPPRLVGDIALAQRIGLTECWTGSKFIVEECRRIGRRARIVHGLMIALPFSSAHTWAEVEVDGIWTPVDPLIIDLMRRWGGLDPAAWPHHRSPGAILRPLVWDPSAPVPLVCRAGRSVPTTFLTRIVAGSS
ncbi:MAG TPA: transglutaminase domain-containing protein [Pyrinomonadaceae bacterium]